MLELQSLALADENGGQHSRDGQHGGLHMLGRQGMNEVREPLRPGLAWLSLFLAESPWLGVGKGRARRAFSKGLRGKEPM